MTKVFEAPSTGHVSMGSSEHCLTFASSLGSGGKHSGASHLQVMSTNNSNPSGKREPGHLVKGCVYCTKAQRPGEKTLQCCSVCKTALYCDTKCQKADWPFHKEHCHSKDKRRREIRSAEPDGGKAVHDFDKWISHHNPLFTLVLYRALKLETDPDAFKTKGLFISFKEKENRESYPLHQRYVVSFGYVADLDMVRSVANTSGAGGIADYDRALASDRRIGMLVLMCPPLLCQWQRAQLMTPEELKDAAPIVGGVPEDWVPWLNKAVNENYVTKIKFGKSSGKQ
ncbi:hypothetical protein CONPUDRAFT_162854 [Coniophora puteana RWD-64-598 SS2]|uniref:MYND-type domain-containing protein n=1 Tax=Coniophora puteana (strain RWD-64-598) TaxID=741705 RepID=A0A5M3N2V7_CONPW|nr:uncharacterized protein CONPUDRAFT_162854 [Coniophora puteana RWD-64-598 SS2]EIW85719.1 hypothetical protein CONPUDRAFT_162854 [Coniophora puteana RWD-64-598 SS2]